MNCNLSAVASKCASECWWKKQISLCLLCDFLWCYLMDLLFRRIQYKVFKIVSDIQQNLIKQMKYSNAELLGLFIKQRCFALSQLMCHDACKVSEIWISTISLTKHHLAAGRSVIQRSAETEDTANNRGTVSRVYNHSVYRQAICNLLRRLFLKQHWD